MVTPSYDKVKTLYFMNISSRPSLNSEVFNWPRNFHSLHANNTNTSISLHMVADAGCRIKTATAMISFWIDIQKVL